MTQRIAVQLAFSENLLEQVLHPENLQAAWKHVRANKGAAGIDGMTIDAFPAWVKSGQWKEVLVELETGQYYPFPVKRVEIDKPEGGKRLLGIPIVTDRVIQQAIAQVLNTTKSHVVKTNDSKFQGFTFRGGNIHWHQGN